MNDKALSLLGISRRAGKLSLGHDASLSAIISGRARLCLLASDVSERLKTEFKRAVLRGGGTLRIIQTKYTIQDIQGATAFRAGVLTIDDEGLADRISGLIGEEQDI